MQLNSYAFLLLFLPVTVAGFRLAFRFSGRELALYWLLFASIVFYGCTSWLSLCVIIPALLLDYALARAMLAYPPSRRKLRSSLFIAGVLANVGFLGYLKYKNFFLESANELFGQNFNLTSIILPLGISFLTFQKIAFLADVKSRVIKSVSLRDFLTATLFFPKIIAGPITHYADMHRQLGRGLPNCVDLAVGMSLLAIGLFKKSIIGDGVGKFAAPLFSPTLLDHPPALLTAWIGALAYTFQLYFDFSGYTDMALGSARLFGVKLPANFNSPLKATSIVEYWSRWHITLTQFLTSYIYAPMVLSLTRSRLQRGKTVLDDTHFSVSALAVLIAFPTIITMLVSGIWHGAGWHYVLWGFIQGIYLTINQVWRSIRPWVWPQSLSYDRFVRPIGFVLTFTSVVAALVVFRAASVGAALSILGGMFGLNGILPPGIQTLEHLGVNFDFEGITLWQPAEPIIWLLVLFVMVTCLPNSLELLRKFEPALSFDSESQPRVPPVPSQPAGVGLRGAWNALLRVGREGASLTRADAWVVGILYMLGLMALSAGGGFLYGQF